MQRFTRPSTLVAVGTGIGLAAFATSNYLRNAERLDNGSPKKTFTGQIGFQSLTLESVEQVNHNVKRSRFALPEKDSVSGLTLNCTHAPSVIEMSPADHCLHSCSAIILLPQWLLAARNPALFPHQRHL